MVGGSGSLGAGRSTGVAWRRFRWCKNLLMKSGEGGRGGVRLNTFALLSKNPMK